MRFIGDPNELYKTILRIVRESKTFLYIVSPYLRFKKNNTSIKAFRKAFIDALNRSVRIWIITRGMDAHAPKNNIYKIRNFLTYQGHILLVPFLHAKIYCNESQALITSLNLSISSLFNQNEESGVLIDVNTSLESKQFNNIISHLEHLKKIAN